VLLGFDAVLAGGSVRALEARAAPEPGCRPVEFGFHINVRSSGPFRATAGAEMRVNSRGDLPEVAKCAEGGLPQRIEPAADTRDVTLRLRTPAPETVRVSDVFSALSFALDLTEGQPMGHALRTCLIGMELGRRLGLPLAQRRDLYYASLLKDVGCSSNAARVFALFGGDERQTKGARMRVDWSNYFRAAFFAMAHAAPGAAWAMAKNAARK
jgi:hypothetical protein